MFIPTEAFGQSWPHIGAVVIVADDPSRASAQLPMLWADDAGLEGTIGLIEAAEVGRVVDGRIEPSAGRTVDSAARREIRGICNTKLPARPTAKLLPL